MLLPILIGYFHDEGIGQQLSVFFFFAFSFKFVKPIRHFYISHDAPYSPPPPPPPPNKKIVQALPLVDCFGQLFKRSPATVIYNRVLSHFQFAERFYVNAIYREQFS